MRALKMTVLALAAPVGACVTKGSQESAPPLPAGFNFAYHADHRAQIGLVQAFDDGEHTYLQLVDRSPHLSIREGADGRALPFHANDRYVTLDGVYEQLLLEDEQASATLVNEAPPAHAAVTAAPTPSPSEAPAASVTPIARVGVPEDRQTMSASLKVQALNRDITALEARIEQLSQQIEAAHQAGAASNLSVRDAGAVPRFVVLFEDNSDDAQIDGAVLPALGAAARAANRIYLHGHTDAFVASDSGTQLAIRRAVAVRALLMTQDVSPARMRLFYRGAGNFVANNSTPEGKAQNRRVEIELRKW
jgi:outer membrane protein OmpA-like peptidoglycan-associated protein